MHIPYLQVCCFMIEPGDFAILFLFFVMMLHNLIQCVFLACALTFLWALLHLHLSNKKEMICMSKKSHLNSLILSVTNGDLPWITQHRQEEKPERISKQISMLKDHFLRRVPLYTYPINLSLVVDFAPSSWMTISFQTFKFAFAQLVCVGSFSLAPLLYLFLFCPHGVSHDRHYERL